MSNMHMLIPTELLIPSLGKKNYVTKLFLLQITTCHLMYCELTLKKLSENPFFLLLCYCLLLSYL